MGGRRRVVRAVAVAIAGAVALSGCTRSVAVETPDDPVTEADSGSAPPDPTTEEAVARSWLEPPPTTVGDATVVGPEGGTVVAGPATVRVPPAAVPDGATIAVWAAEVPDADRLLGEWLGPPVLVDLGEVALRQPVRIDWDVADLDDLERGTLTPVRWDEQADGQWVPVAPSEATVAADGERVEVVTTEVAYLGWVSRIAPTDDAWEQPAPTGAAAIPCDQTTLPRWVLTAEVDAEASADACVAVEGDRAVLRLTNGTGAIRQLRVTDGQLGRSGASAAGAEPATDAGAHPVALAARQHWAPVAGPLLTPGQAVDASVDRPGEGAYTRVAAEVAVTGETIGLELLAAAVSVVGLADAPEEVPDDEVDLLLDDLVAGLGGCAADDLAAIDVVATNGSASPEGWSMPADAAAGVVSAAADVLGRCVETLLADGEELERRVRDAARDGQRRWRVHRALGDVAGVIRWFGGAGRTAAGEAGVGDDAASALATWFGPPTTVTVALGGPPAALGGWEPTCSEAGTDASRLSRNLALQPGFADPSRPLTAFDDWEEATAEALAPLAACEDDHLTAVAERLTTSWDDADAVAGVAEAILALARPVAGTGLRDESPRPGCETYHLSFVRGGEELASPSALVLVGRDPNAGTGQAHPSVTEAVRVVVPTGVGNGPEGLGLLAAWAPEADEFASPLLWVCGAPNEVDLVVAAGPGAPAPALPVGGDPDTFPALPGITIELPEPPWRPQPLTGPLEVVRVLRDDAFFTSVDVGVRPGRTIEGLLDDVREGYRLDGFDPPTDLAAPVTVSGARRAVDHYEISPSGDVGSHVILAEIADGVVVQARFHVYVEDAIEPGETERVLGTLRIDPDRVLEAIGW
jgi:hypothetical protein